MVPVRAMALQKLAEEMEKNEKDIVNRNITQETLKRQQDIMVRLAGGREERARARTGQQAREQRGSRNPAPTPPASSTTSGTNSAKPNFLRTVPRD